VAPQIPEDSSKRFLVALLTGEALSATALLIEEIGFRRYRAADLARLTA